MEAGWKNGASGLAAGIAAATAASGTEGRFQAPEVAAAEADLYSVEASFRRGPVGSAADGNLKFRAAVSAGSARRSGVAAVSAVADVALGAILHSLPAPLPGVATENTAAPNGVAAGMTAVIAGKRIVRRRRRSGAALPPDSLPFFPSSPTYLFPL